MAYEPFNDVGATAQLFEGQDLYVLKHHEGSNAFPWEGDNSNKVAILYSGPEGLAPEDREQMVKILAALKLDPKQIALINLAQVPEPVFSNVANATGCKYLISFGPTPAQMQLLVAAKRYVELNMSGVKVLFSDSLETLRQDAARKRYLWDCLQVVFGLK